MEKELTISVIVVTWNRYEVMRQTIESLMEEIDTFEELILVDNASTDETREYGLRMQEECEKFRIVTMDKNYACAGGRNGGIRVATGDIIVIIDDDAVLKEKGFAAKVREKFQDEQVGGLAFQIINYYSGEMQRKEIPFTDKSIDLTVQRKTSAFIGAGNAIRRQVYEECGLYPVDFFYGGEELDVAFGIIAHGYDILYCPDIQVLHKQAGGGRPEKDDRWIMTYRNRLITAYRYLPLRYRIISGITWYIKICLLARNLTAAHKAIKKYNIDKKSVVRHQVDKAALKYLKENYGRLYH